MKNIYPKNFKIKGFWHSALLIIAFLANTFIINAQVVKPFTQRTSSYTPSKKIYNIKGDFMMIGNTNLTLQNYGATFNNHDGSMVYVDIDDDGTTLNSSSATLGFSTENGAIPSCSKIIYAGLYWTGRSSATNTPFSVTKMVKDGGSTTVNKPNLTFTSGNNITNTNYTLAITRAGTSSGRNPVYTFSGNGHTYVFNYTNTASPTTVTLSVDGGTATNVPVTIVVSGNTATATLSTPYVIADGTVNLTINKLIRDTATNPSNYTSLPNAANVSVQEQYLVILH